MKQATDREVAVAYLRRAYSFGHPYKAYIWFERFDTFRQANGWSAGQVATALIAEGLTQDEWDNMLARYLYLREPGRVTAMISFQAVLDGDTWGADFRAD